MPPGSDNELLEHKVFDREYPFRNLFSSLNPEQLKSLGFSKFHWTSHYEIEISKTPSFILASGKSGKDIAFELLGIKPKGTETLAELYQALLHVMTLENEFQETKSHILNTYFIYKSLQQRWIQHIQNLFSIYAQYPDWTPNVRNKLFLPYIPLYRVSTALLSHIFSCNPQTVDQTTFITVNQINLTAVCKYFNIPRPFEEKEKPPENTFSTDVDPRWLLTVPYSRSLNALYGSAQEQLAWGKASWEVIDDLAKRIKSNDPETKDTASLLAFVGQQRARIAKYQNNYGVLKSAYLATDRCSISREWIYSSGRFEDQYPQLTNRFVDVFTRKVEQKSQDVYSENGVYQCPFTQKARRCRTNSYWVKGPFKNKNGEIYEGTYLTVVHVTMQGYLKHAVSAKRYYYFEDDYSHFLVTAHRPAQLDEDHQLLDDFMRAQDDLFSPLKQWKHGENPKAFYQLLGRFMWRLFTFMPFIAGTAAIGLFITYAFEIAAGFTPTRLLSQETIDMVAMLSEEDYAEQFYDLLKGNNLQPATFTKKTEDWHKSQIELMNSAQFLPRQILFTWDIHAHPILHHPEASRVSPLRNPYNVLEINWHGVKEFERRTQLFVANRIRQLVDRNRIPPQVIDFLQCEHALAALYFEHFNVGALYDLTENFIDQIESYLLQHSELRSWTNAYLKYLRTLEKFKLLESLPPDDFDQIHLIIKSKGDLDKYDLLQLQELVQQLRHFRTAHLAAAAPVSREVLRFVDIGGLDSDRKKEQENKKEELIAATVSGEQLKTVLQLLSPRLT